MKITYNPTVDALYIRFKASPALRIGGRKEKEMPIRSTVQPGQRGAKKLLTQYGGRVVCVRYRYDEQ